jgi:nitrogen fixation/metabolism regulation signal transduction histidine kinase
VLTFDERLYVKTMNAAGTTSCAVPAGSFHGLKLSEWPRHVQAVAPLPRSPCRHFAFFGMKQWEEQMEYRRADGQRTLLLRGTRLGQRGENGYVVVFRRHHSPHPGAARCGLGRGRARLAHEIKNPLTPIQAFCRTPATQAQDKLPEAKPKCSSVPPAPS